MDEPIIYTCDKMARRDDPNLYQRLYVAVVNDEKDEFMTLINDPGFQQVRDNFTAKLMFACDASEIATAVINGETEDVIDLDFFWNDSLEAVRHCNFEGYIDLLKHDSIALDLAALNGAPRLTGYLLQSGKEADRFTLDLSTQITVPGGSLTILDLLWRVCFHNRDRMEVIRMLVQSAQDKTWVREAFMEYAMNGDLHKVAALFLAVPDLFLSPPSVELSRLSDFSHRFTWKNTWKNTTSLHKVAALFLAVPDLLSVELSSLSDIDHRDQFWNNTTFIKEQLPLLVDVLSSVGQRLAAYIRLEDYAVKSSCTIDEIVLSKLHIDFFLREASLKVHKAHMGERVPRDTSPNDYYLSFFELGFEVDKLAAPRTDRPEWIDDDNYVEHPDWDILKLQFVGNKVFLLLPYVLARKDFDRSEIYRAIPRLQQHDEDNLIYSLKLKGV